MFRLSKKEKITKEEENKPVEDLMNALKIVVRGFQRTTRSSRITP